MARQRGIGYNPFKLRNQNLNTDILPDKAALPINQSNNFNQSNNLYNDWDLEGYNNAYGNTNNDVRFQNEGNLYKQFDHDMNFRGPDPFGSFRSGIGSFYNAPSFQHEGSLQGSEVPAVYPGQRNIHEGFGTADVSSTFPPPEKKNWINKGISKARKVGKMAFGPLMMLANRYNPLNPDSENFNPMLEGQLENYTAQGWRVNDQGQALDGPLAGKNLVSGFGTNDVTQMLRDRLQRIRTRKIDQTESSMNKQQKILAAIQAQTAAENAGYQGTPGGNVGSGVFAKMDQSGKTYGPYGGSGNQGGNQRSQPYGTDTSGSFAGKGTGNPFNRADGGRIGYNRGRVVNPGGYAGEEEFEEFEDDDTLEFMRDQGVPYSEMAEGTSAFDLRVQELVDEGMSWQEAWNIASKEFGLMAEGPEESFSEEGIASIV